MGLVDDVRFLADAVDAFDRALSCTGGAADTLVGEDFVLDQRFTLFRRATFFDDVGEVFIAEFADGAEHRVRGRTTQSAERRFFHQRGESFELVEVFKLALALGDSLEDLEHSSGSFAAGRTLSTRLVLREGHEVMGDVDHAIVFVEDDHTTAAHDRAELAQRFVVDWRIGELGRQASTGGTTGLDRFEFFTALDATADVEDDLAERRAHGHFDQAGVLDLAGQGKGFGAAAVFRTDSAEPVGTVVDDCRDVGKGFNVVDDRRLAPEPMLRWVGRTDGRHTSFTFDRVDQRGFFTADECPGTEPNFDIEAEVGVENVFTKQSPASAVVQRVFDSFDGQRVFGTTVYITLGGSNRVAADDHAFNDVEWVGLEHASVHERTGVAFVGVTDQIFDRARCFVAHGPFSTGWKTAAATATQLCFGDLVDDPFGIAMVQHLGQGFESTIVEVVGDRRWVQDAVVSKRDSILAIEERDVAVEFEEFSRDGLARDAHVLDYISTLDVFLDQAFDVFLRLDSIQNLVGTNEDVMTFHFFLFGSTGPEATGFGNRDVFGREAVCCQACFQERSTRFFSGPTAIVTRAAEQFVSEDLFDGTVEDSVQNRFSAHDVFGEDFVDGLAVHFFILDRHLVRDENADDRFTTTATRAARLMEQDVVPARGGDVFAKFVEHVQGACGMFAGGRTDLDEDFFPDFFFLADLFRFCAEGVEFFRNLFVHNTGLGNMDFCICRCPVRLDLTYGGFLAD